MVPLIREHVGGTGSSMLTASLLLGMMILPTLISVAEAALRAVPNSYYEGALALGQVMSVAYFLRSCRLPSLVSWRRSFWGWAVLSAKRWR